MKEANTKDYVESAIINALEYILSHQSENGSWIEWKLPPGESDAWTTAFIGCKLRFLPQRLKSMIMDPAKTASEWIAKKQYPDGGWGYNDFVGSDADSTAYCIIFLDSMGKTVPYKAYLLLDRFQSPDGGFSTYISRNFNGSWGTSHPDVTPVALMAAMTKYGLNHPLMRKGIEYVLTQQTPEGIWNSFWWNTFLYSTELSLAVINAVETNIDKSKVKKTLLKVKPENAFEAAILISSLLYTDPHKNEIDAIDKIVNDLLKTQQPNGSWISAPILRLTDRKCFEPWKHGDSGTVYLDPNRLFTTSTVVEALSKVFECF